MPDRSIAIVLLANVLLRLAGGAGGAMVGFYLAALAERGLPIDAGLLGLLNVVANLAELLLAIPLGLLADRYTPRAILVVSTLIGAAATQLFGISGVVAIFFVSRSLESVAAVAGAPALLSFLAGATRDDAALRGRVMGYYELSLLGGIALGGVAAGALWDAVQTLGFSVLAGCYCAAALLFAAGAAQARAAEASSEHPLGGLRLALRDPLLVRLAPAWLAVNALIGLWLTQLSFQLTGPPVPGQVLPGAFTARDAGFVQLGFALALASGVLGWSFALARIARIRALRSSLLALLVVCAAIFVLNLPLALPAGSRLLLAAVLAFAVAVASGFTPAALAYLADITSRREGRGAALGIYTFLFSLGAALGSAIGGWLGTWAAIDGLVLGSVVLTLLALAATGTMNDER